MVCAVLGFNSFTLSVEAPKDVETIVIMPNGAEHRLENGNAQFTCDWEG